MGSPKRLRKKYEMPPNMWDSSRIAQQHEIKEKYGLRKMRELWQAESELSRIRKNVREILAGRESEETGRQIISRLASYGIVKPDATLDELLSIGVDSLLERRLQTVVAKKGLARTLKQARQLITHGFIAINGKKVTTPSYEVKINEESVIGYYKPIDVNAGVGKAEQKAEAEAHADVPENKAKDENTEAS
ncbi:MAG: 30S ribosomal protein S4 [Candidatus Micrarchaeia archaeon]